MRSRYDDGGPSEPPEHPRVKILEDIDAERARQESLALGGNTKSFDATNTRNDWVAYAIAYLGRASDKVFRNQREKCDYRENMVKAAAIIVAAIEQHDCPPEPCDIEAY